MIQNLQREALKTLIKPLIDQMTVIINSQTETKQLVLDQKKEITELLTQQQLMHQKINEQKEQIKALEKKHECSLEKTCDDLVKRVVEESNKLIDSIKPILDQRQELQEQIRAPILDRSQSTHNQIIVVPQNPAMNSENKIPIQTQPPNRQNPALLFRTKTGKKIHIDGCEHLAQSRILVTKEEAHLRNLQYCKICCLSLYYEENAL